MNKIFKHFRGNLPILLSIAVPAVIAVLAIPAIFFFCLNNPGDNAISVPAFSAEPDSAASVPAYPSDTPDLVSSRSSSSLTSSGEPSVFSAAVRSEVDSSSDGGTGEQIRVDIEPARNRETIVRTSVFFQSAIPELEAALADSRRYSSTILLDPGTKTSAYILAKDASYAANLNGYFYYLIDGSASAEMVSPAVLSISSLFGEDSREACTGDGTFAQPDILDTLKASLKAVLGIHYSDEIYKFIYDRYRTMFSKKMKGERVPIEAVKLVLPGIDIVYRDSFMTYVEFYIKK
ncbi:MAG: hypothetical protein ACYC5K_13480 [Saccharofermentanales bacterium]